MPSRVEDYEVLYTIGTGSYGKCQKIRRKSDGKVSNVHMFCLHKATADLVTFTWAGGLCCTHKTVCYCCPITRYTDVIMLKL